MPASPKVAARKKPTGKPARRARAELSRDRILAAALELIDAGGLNTLNMRDLGQALGASTMSVYRHFRNKSELVDAVVDHVVEGFAPPVMEGAWQTQARTLSLRVRAAMLAHPELADQIGREFRRSAISLQVNAAIIERLRQAGVPRPLLPDTYWAISSYTNGYALLEAQSHRRRRGSAGPGADADRVRKLAAMLDRVEGLEPEVSRDAAIVLARPLDDRQFLFGLDCLIKGIEERIALLLADAGHMEA